MNPLLLLKLAPYVGGALALAAVGLLVLDRNHLAQLNDRHKACAAAVSGAPAAKPLDQVCDKPVAIAAEAAAAAAACDHALSTGDAFAAGQACPAPVKRLVAERDAASAQASNLAAQLDQATADRDAAVSRANARANALLQGLNHAQSVLAAAPRGGDGVTVCDADCLRQLAGAGA